TFVVPGMAPLPLHFGALTVASADERLIPPEFRGNALFPDNGAKAEFRAYKVTATDDIVLLFDDPTKVLNEVFYGDHIFLARGGLLPAGSQGALPHFTAPSLVHVGSTDYPPTKKEGDVFLRILVDKAGAVTDATVFVSSGDGDLDRAAVVSAQHSTFLPAKIDNTPVNAVAFYRQEYRLVSVPAH
ncbi:MAG: TonB family protein, partial [Candidatus Eremiobacteraeota bacterium]|nr:TonB family protein [Candidatus Eremiobacteraeota bacterium]